MNKTLKGIIFTLIGGISWGFCGSCGEFLFKFRNFNPNWVSCVRLPLAGIILFLLAFAKDKKAVFNIFKVKKDVVTLIAFGIFGLLISQFGYLTTISHSNSGTATILQYTAIAMILIVVCLKSRRLPNLFESVALLFALCGTFLIATHGNFGLMVISKECLLWGLFAAVGVVCYSIIPEKILQKYGSTAVSGYGMIIGGIVLNLFLRPWQYSVTLDLSAFLALCGVIIIGTVVAFNLYLIGVSLIGPVKAGMVAAIEPVAAAVFSALWLKTTFSAIDIIGFILIISTVFLINIPNKKEQKL